MYLAGKDQNSYIGWPTDTNNEAFEVVVDSGALSFIYGKNYCTNAVIAFYLLTQIICKYTFVNRDVCSAETGKPLTAIIVIVTGIDFLFSFFFLFLF